MLWTKLLSNPWRTVSQLRQFVQNLPSKAQLWLYQLILLFYWVCANWLTIGYLLLLTPPPRQNGCTQKIFILIAVQTVFQSDDWYKWRPARSLLLLFRSQRGQIKANGCRLAAVVISRAFFSYNPPKPRPPPPLPTPFFNTLRPASIYRVIHIWRHLSERVVNRERWLNCWMSENTGSWMNEMTWKHLIF